MTERPIPFSAEMVRAILAGRKTQTRRVMKPAKAKRPKRWLIDDAAVNGLICPYGDPGDTLWVRETFCAHWNAPPHDAPASHRVFTGSEMGPIRQKSGEYYQPQPSDLMTVWYGAEGNKPFHMSWRPSIHMWRWASRITLEVKSVGVERLQDITQKDAIAEGAPESHSSIDPISRRFGYQDFSRSWFAQTWEDIHGPGAWDDNPWVWVLSFERVKP